MADIIGSCRPFVIIPSNKAYIHSPLEKSNVYKMQGGKAGFFILFSDIQKKGSHVLCDICYSEFIMLRPFPPLSPLLRGY